MGDGMDDEMVHDDEVMRESGARHFARLALAFLGLAALVATTPAFPPTHGLYDLIAPDMTSLAFMRAAGVVAMALSTALAGATFFGRARRRLVVSVSALVGLGVVYLVSILVVLAAYATTPPSLVATLAGALCGAGILASFVEWWFALGICGQALRSMRSMLVLLCASLAAGTLLEAFTASLERAGATTMTVALVACTVAVPIALSLPVSQRHPLEICMGEETFELVFPKGSFVLAGGLSEVNGSSTADAGAADSSAEQARNRRGSREVMGIAFVVGMPVAVFLLYASSFAALIPEGVQGQLVGFAPAIVVGCVLMAALCLVGDDAHVTMFSFRAFLPLLGVAMLGAGNIVDPSASTTVLALGAQGMCYCYGLVITAFVAYAGSRRFRSLTLLFACASAFSVSVIMMMPYYDVTLGGLSGYVKSFVVTVLVADLMLLIASPSLFTWRDVLDLVQQPATESFDDKVRETCDRVAAEYGLTPRESEILRYLGRGYGPSYLATILPIKENTIRSHVRNIYSKLGVSSRADLLSLIDRYAR
jgi:DNA-binding CsgD family transcriptional regulator